MRAKYLLLALVLAVIVALGEVRLSPALRDIGGHTRLSPALRDIGGQVRLSAESLSAVSRPAVQKADVGGQERHDTLPEVKKLKYAELQEIIHRDSSNVVFVNAWATWCKPCREEIPALVRLKKKFQKKNFRLILLSADDLDILDKEVRPALKKLGVDFSTYIMDEKQETFMSAMNPDWNGALALPTTYVHDKDGKLVDMMVGGKEYEEFRDVVTKLMSK